MTPEEPMTDVCQVCGDKRSAGRHDSREMCEETRGPCLDPASHHPYRPMTDDAGAPTVPWEEQQQRAREHYDRISTAAGEWSSFVRGAGLWTCRCGYSGIGYRDHLAKVVWAELTIKDWSPDLISAEIEARARELSGHSTGAIPARFWREAIVERHAATTQGQPPEAP